MIYVSEWERLSDAVTRVIETWALSKDEVQTDICRAIADRAITVRATLRRHATNGFTASGTVLAGTAFEIRPNLTPQDFDWEGSRPLQPWLVRREHFRQAGYWELEWLEVFRSDVTMAFGAAGQPTGTTERRIAKIMIRSSCLFDREIEPR
jgi:hypothetical protein